MARLVTKPASSAKTNKAAATETSKEARNDGGRRRGEDDEEYEEVSEESVRDSFDVEQAEADCESSSEKEENEVLENHESRREMKAQDLVVRNDP